MIIKIESGRCDNCGSAQFKSSVKDYVFLRECRQCGMKKTIRLQKNHFKLVLKTAKKVWIIPLIHEYKFIVEISLYP